ncbi:MAG TPA: queuosine salvage family protein [Solirubrobacteraceae bacterium]|nr:queuosine salvage family protein [Solirubrobacteraceae bacterium]
MTLPEEVRSGCERTARSARSVRIDLEALGALDPGPPPELDRRRHHLDAPPDEVAAYFLTLDTINFGSGWFPTLRKRRTEDGTAVSGYFTVAWSLADRFRAAGPWSNAELRAMRTEEIADTLGQSRDHELMALFAQALRQLGSFLGERAPHDVVAQAHGSAARLARDLAHGMALFDDRGFWKRAQIVPSNLALAGVATFHDVDELTIFADNLVPHVLRCDGVLVYSDGLAALIDAGRPLRFGAQEREIRACAVHACRQLALRLGISERELDHRLWTRGQDPAYKARPRHRCRTVYY